MLALFVLHPPFRVPMDANDALPLCEITGCEWRVLMDVDDPLRRCPDHGGKPVYAYRTDEWGGLDERKRLTQPD